MNKNNDSNSFSIATLLFSSLFLFGCATTAPHATFTQPLSKDQHIDVNDIVAVTVEANQDVTIEDDEKQRLSQEIKEQIDLKKANIIDQNDIRKYELQVLLTRYDKGNSFARFMLAGLGQIHIDAIASVFALPERNKVAEFDIQKTFAWGGIYGGSTSIEDIEPAFAEGVAAAVTGAATDPEVDR